VPTSPPSCSPRAICVVVDRAGIAGGLSVRASFSLSYAALSAEEQSAFRLLGLVRAPDFAPWVLAEQLVDLPIAQAGFDLALDTAHELRSRRQQVAPVQRRISHVGAGDEIHPLSGQRAQFQLSGKREDLPARLRARVGVPAQQYLGVECHRDQRRDVRPRPVRDPLRDQEPFQPIPICRFIGRESRRTAAVPGGPPRVRGSRAVTVHLSGGRPVSRRRSAGRAGRPPGRPGLPGRSVPESSTGRSVRSAGAGGSWRDPRARGLRCRRR
jgi:hypothetical protein